MSDKLGFTFYPKDWWTSETFFDLSPSQRYIYLECLFLMYSNDGLLKTQKTQFENRIRISVSVEDWEIVTGLFIFEDGFFTHPSVNKRLRKAISNRENGKKGGRPPKEQETQITQKNNPKKPTLERERERERETKLKEDKNNIKSFHQQQPKLFIDDDGKPYDKFEPNGKTYVPVEKDVKFSSMDQVARILIASDWLNVYAKNAMIPMHEDAKEWIAKFQDFCITTGKEHLVLEEFKSHCFYWTKKQIENGIRLTEQPRTNGKPKVEDAITRANRMAAERKEKLNNER